MLMGWGYQLRVRWKDLDLSGKRIVLVIEYERSDGRKVVGDRISRRVPLS